MIRRIRPWFHKNIPPLPKTRQSERMADALTRAVRALYRCPSCGGSGLEVIPALYQLTEITQYPKAETLALAVVLCAHYGYAHLYSADRLGLMETP